ncbi:MAG: hypothetical protein GY859_38065, partial [Desulfobacterales bacterium]|nr:hypothetical protein [Desulfobacterales bacterium]
MMTHSEYLGHVGDHLALHEGDGEFAKALENCRRELLILTELNLDAVMPILAETYASSAGRPPRDPGCMLRSLILMTLRRESSVTKWVAETRSSSLPAVLTGFGPDETPGIGTYYDFFDRITDGPHRRPCEHVVRKSDWLRGRHLRSLPAEKEAKKKPRRTIPGRAGQSRRNSLRSFSPTLRNPARTISAGYWKTCCSRRESFPPRRRDFSRTWKTWRSQATDQSRKAAPHRTENRS